ncbi:MAG TPA: VacJ family lipoprotein [Lysobacter sp.]
MPVRSFLALALIAAAPAWAQDAATRDVPETQASTAASAQTPPVTDDAVEPVDASSTEAATRTVDTTLDTGTDAATDAAVDDAQDANATSEDATTVVDDAAATDAPADATAAESDFDALYGTSTAETGMAPGAYDPWEPYNRRMHRFNNAVDRRVAKPLANAYVKVVPRPVRSGVSNFFSNLGQPLAAINSLLQGRPKQAAHALGRFVVNSTLGIGGVFDPASDAKLEMPNEDFGQTLGVWGWKRSRYVELPLFGPRTLRDVVGMVGDAPLSPLRQVEADKVRVPLQGLQLVDLRAQLMSTDALREGAEDDYALVRDAWMQRRAYQIDGDRDDDSLPDYLRENQPLIPVNAMPVSGD